MRKAHGQKNADRGYPLASYCEEVMTGSNLAPDRLVEHYLVDFQVQEID